MDAKSGTAAGLPQKLVEALEQQHLIRSEVRGGTTWYELTHDRFIFAIDSFDRLRRRRLHRVAGTVAVAASLVIATVAVSVLGRANRASEQIEAVTKERDAAQSALRRATTTQQKSRSESNLRRLIRETCAQVHLRGVLITDSTSVVCYDPRPATASGLSGVPSRTNAEWFATRTRVG